MSKKEENYKNTNVLGSSGLNGKTITGISVWKTGSLDVVEIVTASGSTFIKFQFGRCDVGGTADWGSGTMV